MLSVSPPRTEPLMPGPNASPDAASDDEFPVDPRAAKPAAKAPTPEPEPKPEPKSEPAHTHPARLVRLAQQFGMSDADIAETPTAALWQEVGQARQWQIDETNRRAGTRAAPVAPEEEFDLGFDEDMVAPEIAAALKRIATAPRTEIKSLQAKLDALEKLNATKEQAQQFTMVDDAFEALGEEYAAVYGTGSILDMKAGDPAALRRQTAFQNAKIDFTKATPKSVKAVIRQVSETLYGSLLKAAAPPAAVPGYGDARETPSPPPRKTPPRDHVNGQFTTEEFVAGQVARPASRNGAPEPKGPGAAKRAVAEVMKSRGEFAGHLDGPGDDDDLEGT